MLEQRERMQEKVAYGCLASAEESVEEMKVGSWVLSVALLPDPSRAIAGVESGEVLLADLRFAEIVKRYAGHMGVSNW